MDVAVTGSTGLIGTALVDALGAAGHRVVPVVGAPGDRATGDAIAWDPKAGTIDAAGLEGVDAVVHLAGAGIGDRRWNDAYKRELLDSRVQGTGLLARTLAGLRAAAGACSCRRRPSAGTATGATRCSTRRRRRAPASSPTCASSGRRPPTRPGRPASGWPTRARASCCRRSGGALKKELPLFKLGLGGRFGTGRQWQSWIALDDEVRGAPAPARPPTWRGPVNLTAPTPVTNAEMTKTLGAVLHRPTVLPVPSFGPKLLLGPELAAVLLYEGQRVLPEGPGGERLPLPPPDAGGGAAVHARPPLGSRP